ncbi:MAG: TlpA disulfide reductase family protein [Nocardioidaceae bacterium]
MLDLLDLAQNLAAVGRTRRRVGVGATAPAGAATLAMLAVGLSGCSTSGEAATTTGYITGKGVVTLVEPADRRDVPEVEGKTLDGTPVAVSDYLGQIVVLNVWTSDCAPCRSEADDLVAASRQLPRTVFVGINTREPETKAEAFVREHSIPYDSIFDPDSSVMLSFYGMLTPQSLPSTVVIDTQGRIAALVLGEVTENTLVGIVDDVAGEA